MRPITPTSLYNVLLLLGGVSALARKYEFVSRSGLIKVVPQNGTEHGCLTADFTWQVGVDCATFTAFSGNSDPKHFDYFNLKPDHDGWRCGMEHNIVSCNPDIHRTSFWVDDGKNLEDGTYIMESANDAQVWYAVRTPHECEALEMKLYPYKNLPGQAAVHLAWSPVPGNGTEYGAGGRGKVGATAPTSTFSQGGASASCASVTTVKPKPTA